VAGLAAVGTTLAVIATNAAQTATQMINLQNRLVAVTGSTAAGATEFRRVSQLANRLGVDITTLGTSYARFTAATRGTTLEGEKSRQVFESITQASVRMGLSQEQTGRAFTALEQIISKGTLSSEELRGQLAEAIPGATAIMARALGVSTERLQDMMQKGLIPGAEAVAKFAGQLRNEAGPTIERIGVGATRLGNVMKEVATIVGGPFARAWDTAANSLAGFISRMFGVGTAIDDVNKKIREQTGASIKELERLTAVEREALRVAGLPDPRRPRDATQTRAAQLEVLRRANQRAIEQEAEVARFGRGVAEDDRAKRAAAAQMVLQESFQKTQAQQEKHFATLAKIMDEEELLTAKIAAQKKTYDDLLESLRILTDAETAQRDTLIQQATVVDKQIDTNEKRLQQMRQSRQEDAAAVEKAQQDARDAIQRDLDARQRLEARNLQLKSGDEAMRNFQDTRAAMSEEERNAANAHLRSAAAIARENEVLRAQKQELEDVKKLRDLIKRTSMAGEERRPFQDARPFGERERSEIDALNQLMESDPQAYIDSVMRGLRGSGFTAGLADVPTAYDQAMQEMIRATSPFDAKLRETMMTLQTTMPEAFDAMQQQYAEKFGMILQITDDWKRQLLSLGDNLIATFGDTFTAVLNNTDGALHDLMGTMENLGKSLIKLFGEEIIQFGLTPLRAGLQQLAKDLARNETIQKLVGLIGNVLGFGLGAVGVPAGGVSGTGSGATYGPLGVAHGGIFGSVPGAQYGGLYASPSLRLLGEATPEAVVPLTEAGIARFTRGLARGAGAGETRQASRSPEQRWQSTVDALAKRPVVLEVTINGMIDPAKMGLQPDQVVQIVGENIQNDKILRRIIVRNTQR
jgi:tape measure domain-containing protein